MSTFLTPAPPLRAEVLLALKVRELAAKGLPFQTVVSEATAFCTEMTTMFVLESLDNLRKNGRLTGLQSVVTRCPAYQTSYGRNA